jgi:O-Antigen ligase
VSERLPRVALLVLACGLVFHNLVMALLYGAGVHGTALDVVAAWKDVLLAAALVAAFLASRSVPVRLWADRFALAYAALVLIYWVVPQNWLDGEATARGELYALRHHLLPVGAYFLGRLLMLDRTWWRRIGVVLLGAAAVVALWGLIDVYLVPLQTWRESGAPGWFKEQLGLSYDCLSHLPENWIFNTGDETNPIRRVVSTFLSPLASAYLLVVVLLLIAASRPRRLTLGVGAVAYIGLLWTHTRAAMIALTLGLLVLAVIKRRVEPAALGIASLVVSVAVVAAFPTIGPSTSYTASELTCLRKNAAKAQTTQEVAALTGGDSSTRSHLRNLRDGLRTVFEHPQGFGLGNAGVTASRTGVKIEAGESTYTETGVDTGLLGMLSLVGWFAALIAALWRRSAWLAASMSAVAFIGLQTDVIGVHWIAVVVFALAGAALRAPSGEPETDVLDG